MLERFKGAARDARSVPPWAIGQSASATCDASPPVPMPVRRNSGYGYRQRPTMVRWHEGIDIGAAEGTPVYAVLNGRVAHAVTAGTAHFGGYGNVVVIEHDGGLWSLYAHMQHPPLVQTGQPVLAGQQIGQVGGTESSQRQTIGVHLHHAWAVRPWPKPYDDHSVNPELILGTLGLLFEPSGNLVAARTPGMPLENPTVEQKAGRMGARAGRANAVVEGSRLACAPPNIAIVPQLPLPPQTAPAPPAVPVPAPAAPIDWRPDMPRSVRASEMAPTLGPAVLVAAALGLGLVLTVGAKRLAFSAAAVR